MRFVGTCTFNKWLIAAISVLTLLPAPAFAWDAGGKFSLTHEVRWGSVTLPAGDYTYAVEQRGSAVLLLRAARGKPAFLVMAKTVDRVATEANSLVLQRLGDEWFVSEMVVGALGEEFSFATPETNAALARRKGAANVKVASLSQP